MDRRIFIIALAAALTACAPVLSRELMDQGKRDVPYDQMRRDPGPYKGKLYILGGLIVETRITEKGSQLEVLALPVDSLGYLEYGRSWGRFLAVSPLNKGILDPVVYKRGREVTLAGEFIEMRKGKIDEMEYIYPVFEIKELYLWREQMPYYWPPYYPYYDPWYGPYPFPYDRWGWPYPYPWPPPP